MLSAPASGRCSSSATTACTRHTSGFGSRPGSWGHREHPPGATASSSGLRGAAHSPARQPCPLTSSPSASRGATLGLLSPLAPRSRAGTRHKNTDLPEQPRYRTTSGRCPCRKPSTTSSSAPQHLLPVVARCWAQPGLMQQPRAKPSTSPGTRFGGEHALAASLQQAAGRAACPKKKNSRHNWQAGRLHFEIQGISKRASLLPLHNRDFRACSIGAQSSDCSGHLLLMY